MMSHEEMLRRIGKLSSGMSQAFTGWTVPEKGTPVNRPLGRADGSDVELSKTGSFGGVPGFTVKPQG